MAVDANSDDSSLNEEQEKKTVLVVEDDALFRSLIVGRIKRAGFKSIVAENGLIAKKMFEKQEHKIGLVISDGKMPEMTGIELLKYIRTISEVPFILVTGNSETLSQTALSCGATEVISKPFDTEQFANLIKRILA